jgi:phenylacetate-CoA ligase
MSMGHIDSARGSLWQLLDRLRNNSDTALRELKQSEAGTVQENIEHQWARVEALLRHSRTNVPYFRRVLDAEAIISPDGRVFRDAFEQLPLMDKDLLRLQFDELKSDDLHARDWYINTSGGSTGEPVRHVQDASFQDFALATKRLFDEWSGYRVGQRQIRLWGSDRDLLVGREKLKHRVSRSLRNELWLNTFRLTPDRMRAYIQKINVFRPQQVLAYVEAAYELALFAEREELRVHSPAAVMTSAGTLHPHMKEKIQAVFGAPVFNRYGSREVGDVACECSSHQGLHVNMHTHYIEILRPDGSPAPPGEIGEVVVTLLTNFSMPLVRYRIGDMAAWGEMHCSCGCGWRTLQNVSGRTTDVFRRRDGGVVVPEALIHMIAVAHNPGWIRRFQFVQEDLDLVRLLIVPFGAPDDEALGSVFAAMRDSIQKIMGPTCDVRIELSDSVDSSSSGKFRYTVSRVTT